MLDRFVQYSAPRGFFDAFGKIAFGLILINLLYLARIAATSSGLSNIGVAEIAIISAIALPFCILILALIGLLNIRSNRLRNLDERDPLTGLLNRRSLLARLRGAWSNEGVLLIVNADHVPQVADPDAADDLLMVVSERLNSQIRKGDLVARIGDAGFALYLKGAASEDAERIANRLAKAVPLPDRPELGISLAVAGAEAATARSPDRMLKNALRDPVISVPAVRKLVELPPTSEASPA